VAPLSTAKVLSIVLVPVDGAVPVAEIVTVLDAKMDPLLPIFVQAEPLQ
jgi:hypothetical protein